MRRTFKHATLICPECTKDFNKVVEMGIVETHVCPHCNCESKTMTKKAKVGDRLVDGPTLADARIRDTMKHVPRAPSGGVLVDRGNKNYLERGRSDARKG